MITLICATHRPKNQTRRVVEKYAEILERLNEEVQVLNMDDLPQNFMVKNTFGTPEHSLDKIVETMIRPAERLVIISPEYNGSYPGLFKVFLDAVAPKEWRGKRVALVGVASGRAGNLRGMDHLTDVMHYLRAEVFSLKIPISRLDHLLNEKGELTDEETLAVLQDQATQFLKF